jgi:hypothetical protein
VCPQAEYPQRSTWRRTRRSWSGPAISYNTGGCLMALGSGETIGVWIIPQQDHRLGG